VKVSKICLNLIFLCLLIFNSCTNHQKPITELQRSGYPFKIDSNQESELLEYADSLFYFDRNKSKNTYIELLNRTKNDSIYNYVVFQIRLANILHAQFSGLKQNSNFQFSNVNSDFNLLLRQIDSVFQEEKIEDTSLRLQLKMVNSSEYLSGMATLALALNSKYYLNENEPALEYFKSAINHLKQSIPGRGLAALACKEAIQTSINCREYLLSRSLGELALTCIKEAPRDTLISGLAYIASGYSRMSDTIPFSLQQYQRSHELTSSSPYVYIDQEALKYLSHYNYVNNQKENYLVYIDLYKKSAEKYGDKINLNKNLGQFAIMDQRWDDAVTHLEKAKEHYYKRKKPEITILFSICGNLGEAYMHTSEYNKAIEANLVQSGIFFIKNVAPSNIYKVMQDSLVSIDNNYVVCNDISDIYWIKYLKTNDIEDLNWAYKFIELCLRYVDASLNTIEDSKKLTLLNDFAVFFIQNGVKILHEIYEKTQNKIYLEKYLNLIEFNKSSLLYREKVKLDKRYNIDKNLLDQEKLLQSKIEEDIVKNKINSDSLQIWQQNLKAIYKMYKTKYPDYFDKIMNKAYFSIHDVQDLLDTNAAIISYEIHNAELFTFTISKCNSTLSKTGINLTSLDSLITMQSSKNLHENYWKLANTWYNTLIPVELRSTYNLTIIPDISLHYVSFDALTLDHSGQNQSYAIFRHLFNYTPSVAYLINDQNLSEKEILSSNKIGLFSFSDKHTILHQKGKIQELPGAYSETKMVSQFYPDSELYSGLGCTIENFKKTYQSSDFKTIHISTHGMAIKNKRNNAYLLFRSSTSQEIPDTLFTFDIERLNSDADLVILSACESGKGKSLEQEGTYSLARSFLRNGAKMVLSSLWNLDDSSTKRILKGFYAHDNFSTQNRLRSAKLNFLKGPDSIHPYYWSGLISIH
jgi:CHAT domain-containing protein